MAAVDVVLVAYIQGSPGDLEDPPMEWLEVAESAIEAFAVRDSTVVVLHPGGQKRFNKWIRWAAARRGQVAMMAVSSDPGSYQEFLDTAQRSIGIDALDHVFVMPEALAMRGREEPDAVAAFLRTLGGFVRFAASRESPISQADAPKLWSYFDGASTLRRRRMEYLQSEALIYLTIRKLGVESGARMARVRKLDFDGEAGAERRFLALDGQVGPITFPYSLHRHLLHHTDLTQRVIGILKSETSSPAELAQALEDWKVISKECAVLSEQGMVAMNPDPLIRAAMYIADPWATLSRDAQLERETWDTATVSAAVDVINEAKANPPEEIASRVAALKKACKAVDSAGTPDAALPLMLNVATLLGDSMKVQHGAKTAA